MKYNDAMDEQGFGGAVAEEGGEGVRRIANCSLTGETLSRASIIRKI